MRFQVGDVVKMSKNDPHYANEDWEIIKDEEGKVYEIVDDERDPITVRFSADRGHDYCFSENEIRLVRRN